jgi:hypothetical protein
MTAWRDSEAKALLPRDRARSGGQHQGSRDPDVKYCFDDQDLESVSFNMGDIQVRRRVCMPILRRGVAGDHLQLAPENFVTAPICVATVEFIARELQFRCPLLAFYLAKLAFASFELDELGIDFKHKAVTRCIRNVLHHEWSPKQFRHN